MSNAVQLGDIAKIYSGGTPSRTNPEYWGGDIPWVKTTQIQNCLIKESDIDEWITEEGLKHSSAKMVPKGSILMAMIGQGKTRGQVAILDINATTNQNAAAIQLNSGYDRDYIFQQLLFRYEHIRNISNASGQQNLNLEIIRSIVFPAPALSEQTAIADLLSTWDAAIEKTEKLIAAKEKRFLWLQNDLITRHSTDSDCKKMRLGDILTESRLPDPQNDPKKRITVRLHLKGVAAREHRGTEADGATTFYKRRAGQFIYGKQNIFKGSLGIVPPELDGFSSTQDIPAFDIDESMSTDWIYFYFSRPSFYKRLEIYAAGSGSKRLHPKELLKLPIRAPTLPIQNKIAEEIACYKKELDLLRIILEAYRKQKRGLMQKLLTGRWRVEVAEVPVSD